MYLIQNLMKVVMVCFFTEIPVKSYKRCLKGKPSQRIITRLIDAKEGQTYEQEWNNNIHAAFFPLIFGPTC